MPYYKSDFSIVLELADRSGNDIGVPPFDWRASFTTGKYPHYVASSIGGKLRNCVIEDGRIRVLFDRHGLGPGTLKCEFVCLLPDGRYPDSTKRRRKTPVARCSAHGLALRLPLRHLSQD